jgi:hypothetical protein
MVSLFSVVIAFAIMLIANVMWILLGISYAENDEADNNARKSIFVIIAALYAIGASVVAMTYKGG